MLRLIELCIKGELFFFENTFSNQDLSKIEYLANLYFRQEYANIYGFVDKVREELHLNIKMAKIEKVIAL